jgi:hypothetical protein
MLPQQSHQVAVVLVVLEVMEETTAHELVLVV